MAYDQQDLFLSKATPGAPAQSRRRTPPIVIEGKSLLTTPVFEAYWSFAAKRQNVFFKRIRGANDLPLCDDPILTAHRFTNAYRASDRVSQFLLRQVIWRKDVEFSSEDHFFRTLLFKLFNKIETWQAIERELGDVTWRGYSFAKFEALLSERQSAGERNYSAAYIMPSAGSVYGFKSKHANHLKLLEWMMEEQFPDRLKACRSLQDAYELLLSAPSIGPFLAYQLATDLNYGPLTSFSEMEFVKAGPGALDGISKCFESTEGVSSESIIRHMADRQADYFDWFEIEFLDLWGRPLQLIDCQNLFCEISKYSRVAFPEIAGASGRTRIKQKYTPAGRLSSPFYPPEWGLNEKIAQELGAR